jgi:hypothetical protein
MTKTDFAKLFKKPVFWKKASAVLFLAKYKFSNGKVNLVAVPYKKYNEAAKTYKNEVKKDTIFSTKLTILASLEKSKDDKGNLTFKVTPTQGGMNLDFLQTYASDLFGKLKVNIEVVGADSKMENNDLQDVVEAADESLSTKKTNLIVAKQEKRVAKAAKIQEKISAFEKAIGKVDAPKLHKNITILKKALEDLRIEGQADGQVEDQEQKELDRLEQNIQNMEQLVVKVEAAKTIATNIKKVVEKL